MAKKYTQKEFEEKVRIKYDNKIDLSKFIYINSQTKGTCKCNVCGYEWETRPYSLLAGHGCRKCYDERNRNKRLQKLEDVNERIHKSGTNVTIIDEYINTKTKCLARCDKCGYVWRTVPNQLYFGHGCPKCNNCWTNRRKTTDDFVKEMTELYNGEYTYKIDSEYVLTRDFITYVCPIHGEIRQLVYTHSKGNGCPLCNESGMEKKIRVLLEKNKIKFVQWYSDKWLGLQSIDFYIPDIKMGIEVQGLQHFIPNEFFGGQEEFEKRVILDSKKKTLCAKNDVKLVYYLEEKYKNQMGDEDVFFTDKNQLIEYIKNYERSILD